MTNTVTALWYEDTESWLSAALEQAKRRTEHLGLHIDYDHDFLAFDTMVFNVGYDIALIDRNLSNGLVGSQFIHSLRRHGFNTPVVYYTQAHDIDLQKEVAGLEGVTCVLREDLIDTYVEFLEDWAAKLKV
jgi:hypothetical protein